MRKRVFLAVLMIAAIVLTTSCSLIERDATVDAQTAIIEVAGKTITKAEVQTAVDNTLNYQAYMYNAYGMSFDPTSAESISAAQDSAIEALIQDAVINQKIQELGFDTLTEQELSDVQASVDKTWSGYIDNVKASNFADTTLTGDALDQAVAAKMAELGYPTKDALLESQTKSKQTEKLRADVVKDVTVTDQEISDSYTQKLDAAKSSYASNLVQYATDVSNGTTIYYRPAGYRHVKNILRKLSDADSTAISDLQSQITAKQSDLDTNATSIAALPTDATTDTADQAQSRTELTAAKAQLETELADLNTQLDAAKAKAYAALQPTVDEIVAKLAAGEDFDALMAQYGEDTGMQSDPGKTEGYLVCTGDTQWVEAFTTEAMALAKPGDVSAPFQTDYGIHIVKYVDDVTEGAVALEDVKDALQAELLSTKQDEVYNAAVTQWVTDAQAKIYKDRLAD
ncbi:MAG: peptidylprolyl isomerase [Candidatus Limiplasma sp.]|nr:peptidylprolyl isomerase [Candidatus Limiplasma sp.]